MSDESPGWDGPTIPLDLQMIVLMRKYRSAVAVAASNMMRLHQDVERRLGPLEKGDSMVEAFGQDPFFMKIAVRFQEAEERFGDAIFRKSAREVFAEGGEELEDLIVYLAIALWIQDGAEFPEGVFDSFDEEE